MLEANKVRRGRQGERVWLGGVVLEAYHVEGGGVCEYVINEKRGGSVHLHGIVLDIWGHGR